MKWRILILVSVLAMAMLPGLVACSAQAPASSSSESVGSSGSKESSAFAELSSSSDGMQMEASGVVAIGLDSNAGTGYEWKCSIEPEGIIEQLDQVTNNLSASQNITGGPLRDRFSFRAVSPGEVTVTFDLVRGWEDEPAETQTYAFTVTEDLEMVLNPYKSSFDNEPEWE